MRRCLPIPLFVALAAFGQDGGEAPTRALADPGILALAMSDGGAPSKALLAALGRVRGVYEEKPVLFLNVNLGTVGGRHQGEMLFSSLGIAGIWDECRKDPGHLVIVGAGDGVVLGTYAATDDLGAAIEKHLKPPEPDDGCGCDSGCGK